MVHPLLGQSINITNDSFESPRIPLGFPALTTVDGWQKNPAPPPQFGITADQWDQMAGIFPNPPEGQPRHLTNADGNQVSYLFAVPGVGLSQVVPATYTPGMSYSLQVGVRGGGALTPGTQLQIGLFYVDGANAVPVTGTVITASDDLTASTTLRDYSVALPGVKSGDAWLGRPIGVSLTSISQNGGPGIAYWELDRVRLASVPEPSTWALGGVGAAAAWMLTRRRKLH
jgi:hypothetical protein